jgi:hypothetical protein
MIVVSNLRGIQKAVNFDAYAGRAFVSKRNFHSSDAYAVLGFSRGLRVVSDMFCEKLRVAYSMSQPEGRPVSSSLRVSEGRWQT